MKKTFKFGFTLSEVLIALSIAGIVAALVIPPLATSIQNNKNAAALGRSVEVIETGCQLLIRRASENSSDGEFFGHSNITGADINPNNSSTTAIIASHMLFENASEFFNVTPLTNAQKTTYEGMVRGFDGGTASPSLSSLVSNYASNPKLGAYYGVTAIGSSIETADDAIVELIYIDVNGTGAPNRYGLDIFLFGLTDRCNMIPAGSNRMTTIHIATSENACAGTNVTNGLSCTERVIREGYKNTYKK